MRTDSLRSGVLAPAVTRMTENTLDETHYTAASEALFLATTEQRAPSWLQAQASACQKRYENSKISREFESALDQFIGHGKRPFEIFVVGEGNFGKSTLVNALLGQKMSKVDFRPETRSFLRYVLRTAPSDECEVYARMIPGMHDHLLDTLGTGESNELFNTTRHRLSRTDCDAALRLEADRCRSASVAGERYTPAILEVERELEWKASSLFPEGVRLVDTQGLNQIFDDDLLEKVSNANGMTSRKLFESWMSSSPRAKHLDWQFRRCDAVLWLISAQKPNPGASRAAFEYLAKYGKATVLAVTQIDRVQGGAGGLQEVLGEVAKHFGHYAARLVPLNAKKAMEASVAGRVEEMAESGLLHLVSALTEVCLQNAVLIQGKSQYSALRTTEDQIRAASQAMIDSIKAIDTRFTHLHEELRARKRGQQELVSKAIKTKASIQLKYMKTKVAEVTLWDDANSAESKLQTSYCLSQMRNAADASGLLADAALKETERFLQQQEFSLPTFDADGKVHRSMSVTSVDSRLTTLKMPSLRLRLSISGQSWEAIKLAARKMLPFGWGEAAEKEELRLNRDRRDQLRRELDQGWKEFESSTLSMIEENIDTAFTKLADALEEVRKQLESHRDEPLSATQQRLEAALKSRAAESPFISVLVSAFRNLEVKGIC
jgi:GTPase Era involved in 16S rRNA processing